MIFKNKIFSIISLILIFVLFNVYIYQKGILKPHKILDAPHPDIFHIDLNDNGVPEDNELFKLKDVFAYDTNLNDFTRAQAKRLEIDELDYIKAGFLARNWAQNILVDKDVIITSKTDSYNYDSGFKFRYATISFDGVDLGEFYLKNGLGYLKEDFDDVRYIPFQNIEQTNL